MALTLKETGYKMQMRRNVRILKAQFVQKNAVYFLAVLRPFNATKCGHRTVRTQYNRVYKRRALHVTV